MSVHWNMASWPFNEDGYTKEKQNSWALSASLAVALFVTGAVHVLGGLQC